MNDKNIIETILLVSNDPVSNSLIRLALDNNDFSDNKIKEVIDGLNMDYKKEEKGIYIDFIANGYQIRTLPQFYKYIKIVQNNNHKYKMSNAALEVLSIIAFKQPISRLDIELIRGVDCVGVLRKLLDNKLISVKKRKAKNQKLLFYSTTNLFLEIFGLNNIKDLTDSKDIKGIINNETE